MAGDGQAPRLTTAQTYLAFDGIIRRVERWVESTGPSVAGCDATHVRARLVQRIVQYAAADVAREVERLRLPTAERRFSTSGMRIDLDSGKVSISWREIVFNLAQFGVSWARLLLGFLRALLSGQSPLAKGATLVIDAGPAGEESDAEFTRFCREGPIEPLRTAERIIVQGAPSRTQTDPDFLYTTDPLVAMATQVVPWRQRWSLLLAHLTAPPRYAMALLSNPATLILGRDIASLPAVRWFDRRGMLQAIVTSTSAFMAQPLWMKGINGQRFPLHMLWYSQNFVPKMYVGERQPADLPAARHMRVDVHWVWTKGFGDYLRRLGHAGEVRIVGPILWYLPRPVSLPGDGIAIAVFDITPFTPAKEAFGAAKNYYSVETISRFISDILEARDAVAAERGEEILVFLKHKRAPSSTHHDSAYLEFLQRLTRTRRGFSLIDHRTNTFGFLEACDLSISVPYTSTAYVAASIGKHAVYYDPFAELVPRFEHNEFVHFAAGPAELLDSVRRLIPT